MCSLMSQCALFPHPFLSRRYKVTFGKGRERKKEGRRERIAVHIPSLLLVLWGFLLAFTWIDLASEI